VWPEGLGQLKKSDGLIGTLEANANANANANATKSFETRNSPH
jgi:hypothetical protein